MRGVALALLLLSPIAYAEVVDAFPWAWTWEKDSEIAKDRPLREQWIYAGIHQYRAADIKERMHLLQAHAGKVPMGRECFGATIGNLDIQIREMARWRKSIEDEMHANGIYVPDYADIVALNGELERQRAAELEAMKAAQAAADAALIEAAEEAE